MAAESRKIRIGRRECLLQSLHLLRQGCEIKAGVEPVGILHEEEAHKINRKAVSEAWPIFADAILLAGEPGAPTRIAYLSAIRITNVKRLAIEHRPIADRFNR